MRSTSCARRKAHDTTARAQPAPNPCGARLSPFAKNKVHRKLNCAIRSSVRQLADST